MPPRKEIDYKKLLKAIEGKKHQNDIMKEFGFKTITQLKNAYATALMEEGKVAPLVGGRGPTASDDISDEIEVGKRGSLIIPKKLAEKLELKEGDKFKVRKSAAGLSLKRL